MSFSSALLLTALISLQSGQGTARSSFLELTRHPHSTADLIDTIRARPDEARSAVEQLLALAAGATRESTVARHLRSAQTLAGMYAQGLGDSTLTSLVERFRRWSPTQRSVKIVVDSLRRFGNATMGSAGASAAIRVWRQSLAQARSIGDTAGMAAALGNIGAGFHADRRLDSAVPYLQRSYNLATLVRDDVTAGNALSALGSVSKDRGDLRKAADFYAASVRLRTQIGDTRGLAADHNNQGLIAGLIGDSATARRSYERALALNRRYHRLPAAANNLVNLANLSLAEGAYRTAGIEYLRALAAYQAAGDRVAAAMVLRNLGLLAIRRGDYPGAKRRLEEALAIYVETGPPADIIKIKLDLASVLGAMGQLQAALGQLQGAEETVEREPDREGQAKFSLTAGDLSLLFNNLTDADRRYRRAEALFRQMGDGAGEGNAQLGRGLVSLARDQYALSVRQLELARRSHERAGESRSSGISTLLIGFARENAGDSAAARRLYLRSIEFFRKQGDRANEATALGALAGLEAIAGLPMTAESLYALGVRRLGDNPQPHLSWWLLAGWGAALESRGALTLAATKLEAALSSLESISGTLREPQRRTAFLADKWEVYSRLAQVEIARGNPMVALQVSERLRSRQMLDLLARGRIGDEPSRTVSSEEQDLRYRVTELTNRMEAAGDNAGLRGPDVTSRSLDVEREALSRVQARYATLMLELRESRREYADVVTGSTIPVAEVQRRLRSDEILLEYLLGDSASAVFALTHDTLVVLDLGVSRETLARLIDFARGTLRRPDAASPRSWRGPLRQLFNYLIGPLNQTGMLTGKRRLIVVPHAELHYMPFAALLNTTPGDRYLIQDFEISYTPSASVWARLGDRGTRRAQREILAVAPEPSTLPGSSAEVDAIGLIYGTRATILKGGSGTETRFRELAPQYEVLHLATYGVLNLQNPLFSFMTFQGDRHQDGRLEVHEVFGLSLAARLVVLSACQTGLASGEQADVPGGDDWVGLVRAFLFAGASRVVATAWAIEDRSTAPFMDAFYSRLASGKTESQALAETQRLVGGRAETSHPFYWAGFLLSEGR